MFSGWLVWWLIVVAAEGLAFARHPEVPGEIVPLFEAYGLSLLVVSLATAGLLKALFRLTRICQPDVFLIALADMVPGAAAAACLATEAQTWWLVASQGLLSSGPPRCGHASDGFCRQPGTRSGAG